MGYCSINSLKQRECDQFSFLRKPAPILGQFFCEKKNHVNPKNTPNHLYATCRGLFMCGKEFIRNVYGFYKVWFEGRVTNSEEDFLHLRKYPFYFSESTELANLNLSRCRCAPTDWLLSSDSFLGSYSSSLNGEANESYIFRDSACEKKKRTIATMTSRLIVLTVY